MWWDKTGELQNRHGCSINKYSGSYHMYSVQGYLDKRTTAGWVANISVVKHSVC